MIRTHFVILVLLINVKVFCEDLPSIQETLKSYETKINTSLDLDKQDRSIIKTWREDVQVKIVNVTSEYRLQMTRHEEHNFRRKYNNKKWQHCLDAEENKIKSSEKLYFQEETACLKVSSSADEDKKTAVQQVEKEIRKWRKSYRYLINLCHSQNYDEEKAGVCLVEYMQTDNYDKAFERLILLKLDAMGELYTVMRKSVMALEECLKIQFSEYLQRVRNIMERLNRCYTRKIGTKQI